MILPKMVHIMINMSGAVTFDFVKPQNDKRYVLLKTDFLQLIL